MSVLLPGMLSMLNIDIKMYKSTLFDILYGLKSPSCSRFFLDFHDITSLSAYLNRSGVAGAVLHTPFHSLIHLFIH